jgi:Family of unknown function (DUF5683)
MYFEIMLKNQYQILLLFLFFAHNLFGQISKQDSLRIKGISEAKVDSNKVEILQKQDTTASYKARTTPRIATKKSAMFPGLGQIYIKQTWFVPVIYAGFGTAAYFIGWNGTRYKAFRKAYFEVSTYNDAIPTDDFTTPKKTKGEVTIKGVTREYSIEILKQGTNYYRRNRDLTWMSIPLIWAAQILEVNVAAHLKTFDMSDDISMKFEPSFEPTFTGFPSIGGKLVFAFR